MVGEGQGGGVGNGSKPGVGRRRLVVMVTYILE